MDPIDQLIQLALKEDLGTGDVTSEAIFTDPDIRSTARLYAKEDLVLAGVDVAQRVFKAVDPDLQWRGTAQDGAALKSGDDIATVEGAVASLLNAERLALNFLQQLSGIASLTARFVRAVEGSGVKLRDTRKTIPGLRLLSKQAAAAGGAENHRMGLYDQFLIKDNHIDVAGSIAKCVEQAKEWNARLRRPSAEEGTPLKIQVEVRNAEEAEEAVTAGADSLLLDNMTFEAAEAIAERYRERVELEASGNINLVTVARWARTGVHVISIGALTHSAPSVDIAMKISQ